MKMLDSRRWPGVNLLLDRPGAVVDVAVEPEKADALVAAWRRHAGALLQAVSWGDEQLAVRQFEGGATLAFTAPIDALYAATVLNECALDAAICEVEGKPLPNEIEAAADLRGAISDEANPKLLALRDAAKAHGVAFLSDDDCASVGLGTGVNQWRVDALPDPADVGWDAVHDIPVLMVTGTNGKSTTVRLLANMIDRANLLPGVSSTDWIRVGDEVLDKGDWSGPGGAREILRDCRVDVAVLETARGGMLRRGLGFDRANAAAILNVAEDHLGEWGVADLDALVDTKFILAKAVRHGAPLVLNADNPPVLARGLSLDANIFWFSLDKDHEELVRARAEGRRVAYVDDGMVCVEIDGFREEIIGEADIPITYGGTARFNTQNVLAAVALAYCIDLPLEAVWEGIDTFDSTAEANPGRMNRFDIEGATVFADFAHNPHGLHALFEMAKAMNAKRTCVLLGQAGDRTDADIRKMVETIWAYTPDRIVVKDMPEHMRGREPGEMVALIDSELARVEVPAENI
ncbi:MAG: Mur ligase family protein, partial [Planctomycetota bacterium]|nr:Mur ligase family protein [Planctomycetota bacterium]